MKFSTKYDRNYARTPAEVNFGKRVVETAGYMPPSENVQRMLLGGNALVAARAEEYDVAPGERYNIDNLLAADYGRSKEELSALQAVVDLKRSTDTIRAQRLAAERETRTARESAKETESVNAAPSGPDAGQQP